MTDVRQDEPRPGFNLRTIGPEPSGATPLEPEDLEGLIPDFVATRADLNVVEFENITKALPWALRQARSLGPEDVLAYGFMMELHRRMFGDVWTWAGMLRAVGDLSRAVLRVVGLVPARDHLPVERSPAR